MELSEDFDWPCSYGGEGLVFGGWGLSDVTSRAHSFRASVTPMPGRANVRIRGKCRDIRQGIQAN